ncbi:MAG: zeta toxin family protein [Mycobacterium sp.]
MSPRLDVVAGPNGAGKSTFITLILAALVPGSVVVDADQIARERWPDDPAGHAYDAAGVAADTRARLIEMRRSFIAETVFSHPSKVELIRAARAAGYTTVLHVLLIPEELAVERVKQRARTGGHDVPEAKIRERHRRLWALVAKGIAVSDSALVYDSTRREGPRIVATMTAGQLMGSAVWPAWTPADLRRE